MLYILVRIGKYWSAVALVASIALLVISHHFTMDWSTGKIPGVKRGGSLQVTKRGYMITWDARAPLDFGFMGYPASSQFYDSDFDGPFRTGQTRSGFRRWGFMYADYTFWKQLTWTHYWHLTALIVVNILLRCRLLRARMPDE